MGEGCCQETGPWHPHSLTSTHLSHLQPGPSVCFGPDEMEWQVDGCCFKAAHPEDSNAEKQEQCLTSLKGAQTGFAFFFSQSKYQYCCFFKSTGAHRLLPHNSYSLWAHTSLEWTQGNWAPAGSICQARVSPGKTTYLFPFSFRKIFNYYPIRVKF